MTRIFRSWFTDPAHLEALRNSAFAAAVLLAFIGALAVAR